MYLGYVKILNTKFKLKNYKLSVKKLSNEISLKFMLFTTKEHSFIYEYNL